MKLTASLCVLLAPSLMADTATFAATDGSLTGVLQSLNKNGIIEWQSPYSREPLKLLADKLDQVEFSNSPESSQPAPIQFTLSNGDLLPATQVTGMQEAGLIADTTIAGEITIPRAAIASTQFGVTTQKVIYSGIDNIREWTTGIGEPDNWKRSGNSMIASGKAIAARDCQLPENFVLGFGLSWDSSSPNYSIGFADPLKGSSKQNLYTFNFDGSGIRIMRQTPEQSRSQILAQWQRRPSQFSNKSFLVELRVERSKGRMEIIIDGESEGMIVDPFDNIPSGSGVSIRCSGHSGSQTISGLTITELNDIRTRHLAEKRGDPSLDCLITNEDDRWSGQLLSIRGTPEPSMVIFKTSFSEETWEIPETEISTLFFANKPFQGNADGEPAFMIEFHGKGKLSAKECIITGDQVEAIHPLLGSLHIERSSIKLIRRIQK